MCGVFQSCYLMFSSRFSLNYEKLIIRNSLIFGSLNGTEILLHDYWIEFTKIHVYNFYIKIIVVNIMLLIYFI